MTYTITPVAVVNISNGKYYINIHQNYTQAIKCIDKYSHIKIIWLFDKSPNANISLTCHPCNNKENQEVGVFASRSPIRPNPLGITTAKIICVDFENGIIEIDYTDAINNTPIVDIKPYIPILDYAENATAPEWK